MPFTKQEIINVLKDIPEEILATIALKTGVKAISGNRNETISAIAIKGSSESHASTLDNKNIEIDETRTQEA